VLAVAEPTTITHRRGKTKLLAPGEAEESGVSKIGRAAAKLCRLAFELAKAPDVAAMADLALAGLAEGTQSDAGALLLLPAGAKGEPRGEDLEVVASRSSSPHRYHRVSDFLALTVMREGEAVLARNVIDDSTLGSRDSRGEILATSVICAPCAPARTCSASSTSIPRPLGRTRPGRSRIHPGRGRHRAVAVENIRRRQELAENLTRVRTENVELRERLGIRSEIIGRSTVIRQVTEEIGRAAASNATVLIRGESGVGKELVARAVHDNSPRHENVFVCLNCAALSSELLASELFGHERGPSPGHRAQDRQVRGRPQRHADARRNRRNDARHPGQVSPRAGRAPFERVGGSKPVKVDVRVIAATNRDLERDVAEGRFRRDLYFRLRVLEIVVPALRNARKTSTCWPTIFCKSSTPKPAARSRASRPTPNSSC